MSAVFNINLWLIFLERLVDSTFPMFFIFTVLTCFSIKRLRKNKILFAVLLVLLISLSIRIILFFGGVLFSDRYFALISFLLVILSVPGVFVFSSFSANFAEKKLKKHISKKKITLILSVVMIGICVINACLPRFDKIWINEIGEKIQSELGPNPDYKPILITNLRDNRPSYYAGAEYMKYTCSKDALHIIENDTAVKIASQEGIIAEDGRGKFERLMIVDEDFKNGRKGFIRQINSFKNPNVFFLYCGNSDEFEAKYGNLQVEFPLVRIFSTEDESGDKYNLYKRVQK